MQLYTKNKRLKIEVRVMDDETLVNECVLGNAKAQRMLFDKFAPKMMTVCLRYAKEQSEAEDVLQDAFVKVFSKLHSFTMGGSLEGWIRKIMVNTSLDAIRKNKKFEKDVSIDVVDFKMGGSELASDNLQTQDLMKIIQDLPEGYKTVFNLFAIEGYSHKEIGDLLNISENTSKSQYSRARTYLKSQLEKYSIER